MKVQVSSDQHLNFWADYKKQIPKILVPSADYLLLAGDIAPINHPSWLYFMEYCSSNFKKVWTHLIFIFQRANPKGKSG